MNLSNIILIPISRLFWFFNLLVCSTLKYKVIDEPPAQALFAVWHGQSFPLFYWAQHRKLCLLPTDIWRGEMFNYLAKKYKYRTIRFKEKATPLERSEDLMHLMQILKQGYDLALAVDGPPKPLIYHKAKSGILYLSRKSNLPVVPVGINIKRKFVLFWRWDKYEIPLPWSEVKIKFGRPFAADEKTTTQELEGSLLQLCEESQSAAD